MAGTGIGQAAGALTGAVARKLSAEGQAEDLQAGADIAALKRNEFGPSRGQKEQMTADAVQLARSQAQAQRADSARQSAARGFGTADLSGQKIAETAEKTAGSTRMAVEGQAAQSARQLKLDALGRVTKRAEQTQADAAAVGEGLGDLASTALGIPPTPSAKGSDDAYVDDDKKKKAAEALALAAGGVP